MRDVEGERWLCLPVGKRRVVSVVCSQSAQE